MALPEALSEKFAALVQQGSFEGVLALVRDNRTAFEEGLAASEIKEGLKKTTGDRLLLSFIDAAMAPSQTLAQALIAIEKLVSFRPGVYVLSKAWGLGIVRRLDYFYRKITVDFKTRKGHQFAYAAAVDMLENAPEGHILVFREADPDAFAAMLANRPGEFVKAVIKSYGEMTVVRLEDVCVANGFVKQVNWKKFWDAAKAELRKDPLVEIPARKTEPIRVKAAAEDYGAGWLTAFSHETDPARVLALVKEFDAQGKFAAADGETREKIGERLAFAITAVKKVDDALYARLAALTLKLGFLTPSAEEMRAYLRERRRYVKAAAVLPSREVGDMLAFLACDDAAKARLYAAIPELCFTAVGEIVSRFGGESACREAVGALLRQPKAPATLVTLVVGKYPSFAKWSELPPLSGILLQAIALGEGRQTGETLKMQNVVRRLFANTDWLAKTFNALSDADKALVFERFQASIAWDPSTHHTIVARMVRTVPSLERRVVRDEKKKEAARITSMRSFALKKAEYLKLINEDMPANVKRIEFAKSYGDLSENAEYQYAKDEQRALMQKQSLMQADLEAVKPSDFPDPGTEEVAPGVTVRISTPEGERVYHVLGEWDNEPSMGILSSKAQLARNMLGKKAGEEFSLPGAEGADATAKIVAIEPLGAEIREWMKLPEGMQI